MIETHIFCSVSQPLSLNDCNGLFYTPVHTVLLYMYINYSVEYTYIATLHNNPLYTKQYVEYGYFISILTF